MPLADFGARLAAAQCGRVFRCCSTAQVQALYGSSVSDESTCVAELTQLGQRAATQLGQQQTAGRLRYDGRAAAACFANMGNAACTAASNDWSGIPNCDAYIVPLVATGGACDGDEECLTGFCDRPAHVSRRRHVRGRAVERNALHQPLRRGCDLRYRGRDVRRSKSRRRVLLRR